MIASELVVDRRRALKAAGLIGAGGLGALMAETVGPALATASADGGAEGQTGLEGAWLQDVVFDDGQPSRQVLALYTRGGGVAAIASSPPTTISTGFGAWEAAGDRQSLITFELFTFDGSGTLAGILRIRALATIDETGKQMKGNAQHDFQPAGSASFFPAGTTHFTGRRINPLPLG